MGGVLILNDQTAYRELWTEDETVWHDRGALHVWGRSEKAPKVDFSTHTVLALHGKGGSSSAQAIEITDVEHNSSNVVIHARKLFSEQAPQTQDVTTVVYLIAIPKTALPVALDLKPQTY